ncbi:Vms1/Ankzf1 family peptidyl-tRNA hydrolase [Actinoplanes sp. Pm04-4]|uniref:Vms1/Ankzf1 family peptidyl-tRNA hydrolase n=1 Tax=Paractinoplanes pyxinae TaxID=2997416 RepID=A0ABT4BG60_9ACTN|nr:Vms1/Ankzf1 family peptidyl-tRNA hydrolase [Actinoplanes pyxinae]MCY1145504.1 Vms1/Ankzf1 family peptidyl-tRNA hydrolase [Actinoplanes pyxinae]
MNLTFLRPLYDRPGSWVSVYLDTTRSEQNAEHEIDLRLRAMRETLTERGADPAAIDAVEDVVRERPFVAGRHGIAVFANGAEVALAETLPAAPISENAYVEPLPHAMPLLAQRGEEVPYVRVLADRTGGDIDALSTGGAPRHEAVQGGETFPIHKARGGGWSTLRFQHSVEETWKRNAGDVAAAAADLAESVGAEVIVVGGDVHAVQDLIAKLPKRWHDRVVRTEAGSRGAGADESALDDVTLQAVAETADRHVRDVIDRFRAQQGDGSAATGLTDVVAALQRGQVDAVLLINDMSSTDKLWIDPDDPTAVSVDDHVLREAGVKEPVKVRADAALVRAAAGTGAQLYLVSPEQVELEHGIGAVMRYSSVSGISG